MATTDQMTDQLDQDEAISLAQALKDLERTIEHSQGLARFKINDIHASGPNAKNVPVLVAAVAQYEVYTGQPIDLEGAEKAYEAAGNFLSEPSNIQGAERFRANVELLKGALVARCSELRGWLSEILYDDDANKVGGVIDTILAGK